MVIFLSLLAIFFVSTYILTYRYIKKDEQILYAAVLSIIACVICAIVFAAIPFYNLMMTSHTIIGCTLAFSLWLMFMSSFYVSDYLSDKCGLMILLSCLFLIELLSFLGSQELFFSGIRFLIVCLVSGAVQMAAFEFGCRAERNNNYFIYITLKCIKILLCPLTAISFFIFFWDTCTGIGRFVSTIPLH
jgi:hypothetical protein